ncbi:MAG TPA: bifunctional 5,10-methylene-tetrahydrofolate dehydrogenase/5,10-methylene-tetrahydrofolate cyclohydrolase, partial [Candidatus Taylorbacteria bacterium]|nr:bifunctional 5,10-methylene-tetrahydrofolate dehydrogenase/5,10-methylene-tetrahydrofolate cyclohydrolase [Candidatus Taylorbacteria bacterium]
MPLILDGKKVRGEIAKTLRRKVEAFSPKPKLAIVQVGTNKESSAYVRQKKKFGESIGVLVDYLKAPEFITESELILKLKELNADSSVSGIIVQLPLPSALSVEKTINAIDPEKDVDGLTAVNEQLFKEGKPRFIPATARGIIELLEWYHLPLFDAKVAVLGRSKLVGAPTALLLKKKGALVTVCHSKTPNTKTITRRSDI